MTADKTHFRVKCDGVLIPFGAKVSNIPTSSKDKSRLHQPGEKMFLRIFMGFVLRVGGAWSGVLLIVG